MVLPAVPAVQIARKDWKGVSKESWYGSLEIKDLRCVDMVCSIHRRTFCKDTVVSAAGIMLGGNRISSSHPGGSAVSTYAVMQEVMKYRKLDAHAHVGFSPGDAEKQLDIADRLGITKMCISRPVTNFSGTEPETPDEVRKCNDVVIQAVKSHRDRYFGYFKCDERTL